jgi:hypothetical protein
MLLIQNPWHCRKWKSETSYNFQSWSTSKRRVSQNSAELSSTCQAEVHGFQWDISRSPGELRKAPWFGESEHCDVHIRIYLQEQWCIVYACLVDIYTTSRKWCNATSGHKFFLEIHWYIFATCCDMLSGDLEMHRKWSCEVKLCSL